MRRSHVSYALAIALAGCAGMMTGPDAMRGAVADAVAEDNAHLSSAQRITTMPAMLDEVDRHTSRMAAIMASMRNDMGGMQHCAGIGDMMDLRDGMHAELDAHAATMHALVSVDDARAEVGDHVGTMGAMLDDMDMMLDRMHCY